MAKTDHRLGGGREKEVGSKVSTSRRRFLMHEQPNKTPDIYQTCYIQPELRYRQSLVTGNYARCKKEGLNKPNKIRKESTEKQQEINHGEVSAQCLLS